MSSPYRDRKERPTESGEREPGLVSEMVRQFADPYAFLRELVQNSLDAGTSSIEVDVIRGADGDTKTRVTDSGSGMTPRVIETSLLTLFNSSKEGDRSKIGKYGVGFISVLSTDPEAVIVDTWRNEGAWRVTLQRDHSYVVEELGSRPLSGTSVTLEHTLEAEAFDLHVQKVRESVLRWCRHARVPVWLSVTDYGNPRGSFRVRLDRPLEIHAAVSVSEVDGDDAIVLGPGLGAEHLPRPEHVLPHEDVTPFAGFYNRGLTLFETSSEPLPGLSELRVKISSSRLQHTLSRDNVKREAAFDELLERARELAKRALPGAVAEALRAQAEVAASGGDPREYLALLAAAGSKSLDLPAGRTWFPLAQPVDGEKAMTVDALASRTPWRAPILTVAEPDALSEALASTGRPVVLCHHADVVRHLAALRGYVSRRVEPAHERHLLVEEDARSASDQALIEETLACLGVAGVALVNLHFARALGASTGQLVVARRAELGVVEVDDAFDAARRWGKGDALVIDARNEAVPLARDGAKRQLRAAAQLLARLLLLERKGPLRAGLSDRLVGFFTRGRA